VEIIQAPGENIICSIRKPFTYRSTKKEKKEEGFFAAREFPKGDSGLVKVEKKKNLCWKTGGCKLKGRSS